MQEDFIGNEMGCLHVSLMHSLIISVRLLSLFFVDGAKKRRDSATRSEYPLTADAERHEKPIGIDIQKRSFSLLLYSSQECTRRQKMTESIFTARLHSKGENKEKNVAKV